MFDFHRAIRMLTRMPKSISDPVQRIASLAPSVTSILVALGARRHLVAVTKWCADVAPVKGLPTFGDCWALDVKALARLKPTLVIGSVPYKPEVVARILDTGATFLATSPRSLADVYFDIRMLGRLVAQSRRAEMLVARMQRAFTQIARKAKSRKRHPRVYCEAWPKPRISSPPWVAELVEIAGGRMVVPAGRRVSDQEVARAAPEAIVIAWAAAGDRPTPAKTIANPAWKDVPAVRDKRVSVVRDELLNTPGPPLIQGARELARIFRGLARESSS